MRIFWISHNNTCSTAVLITEGLLKIAPEIKNLASREDVLWLRKPDRDFMQYWNKHPYGKFPDSNHFVPEMSSPKFWEELENCTHEDVIALTINAGSNHNAAQAIEIIDRLNLYHRTIIIDEDESASKWYKEFLKIYMKSKLILLGHADLEFTDLKKQRPNVLFFGFNGIEDRYLPSNPVEKDIDVFFKSRVEGWLMPRAPFRDRLLRMNEKGMLGNACIMPKFDENQGDPMLKIISGDRHHPQYYEYLSRSHIAIYLNGFNPIGYQFWENAANHVLTLHQTPWRSKYYNGGNHNPQHFHWERYDPPFIPGEDFFYFETPDDLERLLLELLSDRRRVLEAAESCHKKALNFTSENQARKFLKIIKEYL